MVQPASTNACLHSSFAHSDFASSFDTNTQLSSADIAFNFLEVVGREIDITSYRRVTNVTNVTIISQ